MNSRPGVDLAYGPDDPRLYEVDEDFGAVIADLSFMTKVSRVGRARFFHRNATTARGTLTVLDEPTFPGHELFVPGRRFDLVARYGNATVTDDIAPDIRGVTLRLLEPGGDLTDGLLDLTLNTGECFFPRTARVFQRYSAGGADRDSVFEEAPYLRAAMWDVIRRPVSYLGYDYYSQAPRGFVDTAGETWLVRFRLRAIEDHPDQGRYDPGARPYPPDPPELLPRDPADRRPPTFLHDELRAKVANGGVTGVLALALHRLTDSPEHNQRALDASLPWDEDQCPWHDVARIELTGLVDNALIENLAFGPGNAPASLGIALARSPEATASVNHLRALMYRMASYARRGEQLPPALARLARPAPRSGRAPISTMDRSVVPRKVCVIGGGATGLTVARELERAGHRAVVLESRADVGGKCDSVRLGGHAFDLGGHLCTTRYENLAELAVELGVATEDTTPHQVYDLDRHTWSPQSSSFFRRGPVQRYRALRGERFPRIAEPGLAHSAKALAAPVGEWLAEHDMGLLAESFGVGSTAAGYGYLDGDLPALYFVKYVEMTGLLSGRPALLGHAGSFTITGGFLSLWQRVAAELSDVRCGVEITAVDRSGDGVVVHTRAGRVEADELVLTVPVGQLAGVLDLTPEEADIARRVRTMDYHTTVAAASGLPRSAFYLVRQHVEPGAPRGHCVSFHHRYPDSDVYTAYSYGDQDADVEALLAKDFARFGGRVEDVCLRRRWSFMPYFGSADVAAGVYDRIERLQGVRGTYHAGSLPAFELVECNIGYARQLVRRFFPALPGSRADTGAVQERDVVTDAAPVPAVSSGEITAWLVENIAAEARLPVEQVDPDGPLDAFALSSLSVAALQAELSDWLGFRVPPTLFLEVSTITAMAGHLAAEVATEVASDQEVADAGPARVLRLMPSRPFFCVPGAVGAPQYLLALARAVGPTQPFYGLIAPGVGVGEPIEDIAELATHHLREVRRAQPHGPYLLGGHSFGGTVAYEMARLLRARGEQAHVFLLDSYLPEPDQPAPPTDHLASIEEMLAMHHCLHDAGQDPEFAIDPAMPPLEQYERLGRALGATGLRPVEEYIAGLLGVYEGNLAATVGYLLTPTDLPVTLLRAAEGFPQLRGQRQVRLQLTHPHNGWTDTALPGLRVVEVPGNHFTMLTPPHVTRLADVLREELTAALTGVRKLALARNPETFPASTRTVVGIGPSGASMSVDVLPARGWVRLAGRFTGIAADTRCQIMVVTRSGRRILAGGWVVRPEDGTIEVTGSALVAPEDVAAIEVDTETGKPLAAARIQSRRNGHDGEPGWCCQ